MPNPRADNSSNDVNYLHENESAGDARAAVEKDYAHDGSDDEASDTARQQVSPPVVEQIGRTVAKPEIFSLCCRPTVFWTLRAGR